MPASLISATPTAIGGCCRNVDIAEPGAAARERFGQHLFSVSLIPFATELDVLVALKWPVVAMTLICLCLVCYLRPDVPGIKEVA